MSQFVFLNCDCHLFLHLLICLLKTFVQSKLVMSYVLSKFVNIILCIRDSVTLPADYFFSEFDDLDYESPPTDLNFELVRQDNLNDRGMNVATDIGVVELYH